jgi:hypothetical protein
MKIFLTILITLTASTFASIEKQAEKRPVNCMSRVTLIGPVHGNRCRFRDEVMVGIRTVDPMVIECGRLVVTCTGDAELSSESISAN